MTFACCMTFKSIFVSTLLLAHLAIPSKTLKSYRFHTIAYRLRGHKIVLRHLNQVTTLENVEIYQSVEASLNNKNCKVPPSSHKALSEVKE